SYTRDRQGVAVGIAERSVRDEGTSLCTRRVGAVLLYRRGPVRRYGMAEGDLKGAGVFARPERAAEIERTGDGETVRSVEVVPGREPVLARAGPRVERPDRHARVDRCSAQHHLRSRLPIVDRQA